MRGVSLQEGKEKEQLYSKKIEMPFSKHQCWTWSSQSTGVGHGRILSLSLHYESQSLLPDENHSHLQARSWSVRTSVGSVECGILSNNVVPV